MALAGRTDASCWRRGPRRSTSSCRQPVVVRGRACGRGGLALPRRPPSIPHLLRVRAAASRGRRPAAVRGTGRGPRGVRRRVDARRRVRTDGAVDPLFVWAALDCPSSAPAMSGKTIVLASLAAELRAARRDRRAARDRVVANRSARAASAGTASCSGTPAGWRLRGRPRALDRAPPEQVSRACRFVALAYGTAAALPPCCAARARRRGARPRGRRGPRAPRRPDDRHVRAGLRLPGRGRAVRHGPELARHARRVRLLGLPVDRPGDPGLQPRPPLRPGREEGRRPAGHARRSGEPSLDPNQIQSPYDHATETAEPGYYSVFLAKPATKVELTASEHAGDAALHVPARRRPEARVRPGAQRRGRRRRRLPRDRRPRGGGLAPRPLPGLLRRALQPAVRLERHDRQGRLGRLGRGRRGDGAASASRSSTRTARGATSRPRRRTSTSTRCGPTTRAAWNRELSKVRVSGGTELDLKSFYTALYHSQLHPNVFTDVDGRYRGMDDQIHVAEGPHPVLELLVVGPLQVPEPADRDDPARALPRHAAQPAGRPPRGRLHPALEGAVHRRGPHVGRPGDPDDRRRRLPRPRRRRRRRRRSTTPRSSSVARRDPELLELGWLPDRPGHDARVRRRRLRAGAARAPARPRRRGARSTSSAR